jgi:hypothetical protein
VYQHLQSGESLSVRDLQLGCASCGARGEHDLVVAMYEADDGEPGSVSLAAGSSKPAHGLLDAPVLARSSRRPRQSRDQDDDTRLYLGLAWSAALLEVVTIVRDDGSEVAIHAMGMGPRTNGCYRETEHGKESASQNGERYADHRRADRQARSEGRGWL